MPASPGQPSSPHSLPRPDENTVNDGLTPKRRRPVTEYAAFDRRILRAYNRRVAIGDLIRSPT